MDERVHAAADGGLGQLELAHVLLRDVDLAAVEVEIAAAGRFELARAVDKPGVEQRGDGVDQAGAAQLVRRRAADGGVGERAVFKAHRIDRAERRVAAAGDARALERGAGRRGAAAQPPAGAEHHLAVGARVHEQEVALPVCDAAGQHAARDVRADVGRGAAGHEARHAGKAGDARVERAAKALLHVERGHGQRPRLDGKEDVEHGRVARDHELAQRPLVRARLRAQRAEHVAQLRADELRERRHGLLVAVDDARDHVAAVELLPVQLAQHRHGPLVPGQKQLRGDGRRADVDGRAVSLRAVDGRERPLPRGVGRLDDGVGRALDEPHGAVPLRAGVAGKARAGRVRPGRELLPLLLRQRRERALCDHPALAAFAPPAAGEADRHARRLDGGQQRRPRFHRDGAALVPLDHLHVCHMHLSLLSLRRPGRARPGAARSAAPAC